MRAVVQRVARAQVTVDGVIVGQIEAGLLALVAAGGHDTPSDAAQLAKKLCELRIFPDEADKMNRDVREANGAVLAVSQFTLFGDCRRGRRPSFTEAASPDIARPLFSAFVEAVRALGLRCETGVFQAQMAVELVNDGPVTVLLDTEKRF